jgi:hypothetical protein
MFLETSISDIMFDSKVERNLDEKLKDLNIEQLRQGISIRKFDQPLVSKKQILSSLASSLVGLSQERKFNSFFHAIRLLEHIGYRTLLSDDKDEIEHDRYAWLTLLPSANENLIDINSLKVTGVNINSLNDGVVYLDFDSEIALINFTTQLNVAITDWQFAFAEEEFSQITEHIIGQCPLVSYFALLSQWHLDQTKSERFGGGVIGGMRIINSCYPLIDIYFHDKGIEPNFPASVVKWNPTGSVLWIELHMSKEYYVPYLDLLRNEYPIKAYYDTRTDWIVSINAGWVDVGWGHHSRYD